MLWKSGSRWQADSINQNKLLKKRKTDEKAQISVRKEDWSSHLSRIQGPFFEYLMQTDSCSLQWNKLDWSPVAHLEKAVI